MYLWDLHRQLYVLPCWDRSCRSNSLPHPVTVYWHRADQVPALTLQHQVPSRVATGVPILKSLVWLDLEKSRPKRESNSGPSAFGVDTFTTWPTRQSKKKNCRWNQLVSCVMALRGVNPSALNLKTGSCTFLLLSALDCKHLDNVQVTSWQSFVLFLFFCFF